jgi:hypothetical protein
VAHPDRWDNHPVATALTQELTTRPHAWASVCRATSTSH